MRLRNLVKAALLTFLLPWPCASAQMLQGIVNATAPAASAFVGPGDVQASWLAWGGVRAFSAATAGTKSASIRCVTHGTTQDINTLANGNFDVAGLTTICPSDTYFAVALYDKSGNSRDWTQATAAKQPSLTLSCLNTSLPCLHFVRASTQTLNTAGFAASQPYSMAGVARGTVGGFDAILAFPNQFKIAFSSTTNMQMQNCGSALNVTIAMNTWYTFAGACNTSASSLTANTTAATGAGGAASVSSTLNIGADDGPNPLDGDEVEDGFLSVALSSGQVTTLHNNQCAYWGTTC